ncbi:DUF362 domain-containing protein [Cellulosilyticum sp. I15G10I2]|uniref:DUF362 domain-containing protein n=1 Tax=Cellulosilyticum sp. I15G10I2 TaxID=1892843 RepID=UPI00085BC989|nr:DUF362 domain-containing protein [Cellulosilyticum sp. I15G10I2]
MKKYLSYSNHDVAVIHDENESEAVLSGLKRLQVERDIKSDDVVVLTPNWVNNQKTNPSDGVVVGPETLRTIIKWVKARSPRRIIIATGAGSGNTKQVMEEVGFDLVIEEEQVEFIDFNTGPYVTLSLNHKKPNTIKVNKIINEMTYHISFTQLKTHEEATMSASIKNMALSWPTTEEHGSPKKNLGIHEELHGFIAAMAESIKIDLAIVSANPVMIGTGPTKGIDKHTGLIICGRNPIAVDSIGARLLGFMEQGIGYIHLLKNKGFKETDIKAIPMKGLSLVDAEKIFSEKVYGEKMILETV